MTKATFTLLKTFGVIALAGILHRGGYAQNKDCVKDCSCSVTGTVIDASTGEPVAYATVQVKGTEKGALTDAEGHFVLKALCSTEADLLISHIGYKSMVHHHDIYHPDLQVKLATDDMILESIVVEGEAIDTDIESMTESKLSGKDLDDIKNESLGEVLSNITGVSSLKTGQNIVKPIVHGLHSNRVLIINNGVRHEGQGWGDDHAPEIDPSMAENISLVKGAAAVKYGPDAMGGVILINPPKMELSTEHLHGEAGLTAASNGRSLNSNISLQQGYERFAWLGQVSGLYQGDLRAPGYNLTNTGARELSYMFGARYHQQQMDFSVYYSHVEQHLGILRGSVVGNLDDLDLALNASEPFFTTSFSYDLNNPHQEVAHDLIKAQGTYNFKSSQLDVQYGFQINHRQEFDVRRGDNNNRPAIDLQLYTQTVDLDWKHGDFAGWSGTIGAQWLYQDNNNLPGTNTINFVPNYNNARAGVYITEGRKMGSLNFEAGVRYDYQSSSVRGRDAENEIYRSKLDYQSVTGMVGIKGNLGPHTTFQSNIGSAWRPPNIAELYSYGKHEFTIDYGLWRYATDEFGNSASSGEVFDQKKRSINNELGIKWVGTVNYTVDKQSLELTAYANWINNYIYTKPAGIAATVRGPFPYYVYDQTDAVFIGLDASYIIKHDDHWQSQWKGSYLRARDVGNDDVFVGIPANNLGYQLSYSAPAFGFNEFNVSLEGKYSFKQYDAPRVLTIAEILEAGRSGANLFAEDKSNFDFIPAPEDFFLLNAKVSATIDQLIVGLQVKNALNTKYKEYTNQLRYFADEPGINFLLSLRYKF